MREGIWLLIMVFDQLLKIVIIDVSQSMKYETLKSVENDNGPFLLAFLGSQQRSKHVSFQQDDRRST